MCLFLSRFLTAPPADTMDVKHSLGWSYRGAQRHAIAFPSRSSPALAHQDLEVLALVVDDAERLDFDLAELA